MSQHQCIPNNDTWGKDKRFLNSCAAPNGGSSSITSQIDVFRKDMIYDYTRFLCLWLLSLLQTDTFNTSYHNIYLSITNIKMLQSLQKKKEKKIGQFRSNWSKLGKIVSCVLWLGNDTLAIHLFTEIEFRFCSVTLSDLFLERHHYVCGSGLHFLLCMQNILVGLFTKYNVYRIKTNIVPTFYKYLVFIITFVKCEWYHSLTIWVLIKKKMFWNGTPYTFSSVLHNNRGAH